MRLYYVNVIQQKGRRERKDRCHRYVVMASSEQEAIQKIRIEKNWENEKASAEEVDSDFVRLRIKLVK